MLAKDYQDMIQAFHKFNVEYVVVGAYAMGIFGYTRATGDIDFFIKPSADNSNKLWEALQWFGASLTGIQSSDFESEGVVFQIGVAPLRIDILTSIDAVSFENIAIEYHTMDGLTIPYIDVHSLIKNKRATGRLRDLADCEELEKRL